MLAENNFVFFSPFIACKLLFNSNFFLRSTFADNWLDMNYFSPFEKIQDIFSIVLGRHVMNV